VVINSTFQIQDSKFQMNEEEALEFRDREDKKIMAKK
jgi:hypothetical protein